MNFLDKLTGNDIKADMKNFEERVSKLSKEYQVAWEEIKNNLWIYSDFSGRNLTRVFDKVVEILEEASVDGQSVDGLFGGDIKGFCANIASGEGAKTFRDKWRDQLNNNVARKLSK